MRFGILGITGDGQSQCRGSFGTVLADQHFAELAMGTGLTAFVRRFLEPAFVEIHFAEDEGAGFGDKQLLDGKPCLAGAIVPQIARGKLVHQRRIAEDRAIGIDVRQLLEYGNGVGVGSFFHAGYAEIGEGALLRRIEFQGGAIPMPMASSNRSRREYTTPRLSSAPG